MEPNQPLRIARLFKNPVKKILVTRDLDFRSGGRYPIGGRILAKRIVLSLGQLPRKSRSLGLDSLTCEESNRQLPIQIFRGF